MNKIRPITNEKVAIKKQQKNKKKKMREKCLTIYREIKEKIDYSESIRSG